MSESVLKSILEESAQLEWAKYDGVPEHSFSRKHCRSMKRIFRLYDKQHHSYSNSCSNQRVRITRKTALLLVLIVFLAAAGCAAAYFFSQSFRGEVHSDNTALFVINTDNCPSIIEDKYYLSDLPQDFELLKIDSTPFYEYTSYKNEITGQTLSFSQWVKSEFNSHYNTEEQDFEEIEINGHYGLCLEFCTDGRLHSCVIWDNGDYIFEISGDLPKNKLIDLVDSTEVFEN